MILVEYWKFCVNISLVWNVSSHMFLKSFISSSFFKFEILIIVVTYDMHGAIDISDLSEVKFEDVKLKFDHHIGFL